MPNHAYHQLTKEQIAERDARIIRLKRKYPDLTLVAIGQRLTMKADTVGLVLKAARARGEL